MEPLDLIVMALASGAAAGMAEESVREIYSRMKELIQRKASSANLKLLEDSPESEAPQAALKENLAKTDIGEDKDVLLKAKELLDAVSVHSPYLATAIGVSIEDVRGASLEIEDIVAVGTGVGVRVKGAEINGAIDISNVRAGDDDQDSKKV